MFRFSIRELMLVTLVVALAVAWWVEHKHFSEEHLKVRAFEEYHRGELRGVNAELHA